MIVELLILFFVALIMATMTVRMIGHDEHYGQIGFGAMTTSAANAFSSAPLPEIAEPDIIIKTGSGRRVLEIDIDDILVWDVRRWNVRGSVQPITAAGDDIVQEGRGGITKDNNAEVTQGGGPTAESIAQGTRQGGQGAAIVGSAGLGTTQMNGDESPRFEAYFDYGQFGNEENAAGEINNGALVRMPLPHSNVEYSPYSVNGITCHRLLTAAHYWLWGTTTGMAAAFTQDLGADVRRMSLDVEEMMFDREVLLSILDALVVSN